METKKFKRIWDSLGPYQKELLRKKSIKKKMDIGGMLDKYPKILEEIKKEKREWSN